MPIAKIVKGSTPEGCLAYVLGKTDAVLHETNCVSTTVAALAHEFDLARQAQMQSQRRGRKTMNSVCHTSIAFDWDAQLSTNQKLEIAGRYLEGMGFDRTQNAYVIAEHHDTRHQHLHIITSRIRWDGYTTPAWQDYQRAEAIMRQVEVDYGLKPVANSRDTDVKAPTVAEVRRSRATGKPIPRVVIQQAIDDCIELGRCRTLGQLQQELDQQHGITMQIKPMVNQAGVETWALLFDLEGITFSASKLGKKYRYRQLSEVMSTQTDPALSTNEGVTQAQAQDRRSETEPDNANEADGQSEVQILQMEADSDAHQGGGARCESESSVVVHRQDNPAQAQAQAQARASDGQWRAWLEQEQSESEQEEDSSSYLTQPEVEESIKRDWALWRMFELETQRWLAQKGLTVAEDRQRRLAQVALYCRLKHYSPEQVARALTISPDSVGSGQYNSKVSQLPWQQREKERFAVLWLMVKVDEQVQRRLQQQREIEQTQR